jgi:hypothetical protein
MYGFFGVLLSLPVKLRIQIPVYHHPLPDHNQSKHPLDNFRRQALAS